MASHEHAQAAQCHMHGCGAMERGEFPKLGIARLARGECGTIFLPSWPYHNRHENPPQEPTIGFTLNFALGVIVDAESARPMMLSK